MSFIISASKTSGYHYRYNFKIKINIPVNKVQFKSLKGKKIKILSSVHHLILHGTFHKKEKKTLHGGLIYMFSLYGVLRTPGTIVFNVIIRCTFMSFALRNPRGLLNFGCVLKLEEV